MAIGTKRIGNKTFYYVNGKQYDSLAKAQAANSVPKMSTATTNEVKALQDWAKKLEADKKAKRDAEKEKRRLQGSEVYRPEPTDYNVDIPKRMKKIQKQKPFKSSVWK